MREARQIPVSRDRIRWERYRMRPLLPGNLVVEPSDELAQREAYVWRWDDKAWLKRRMRRSLGFKLISAGILRGGRRFDAR